MAPREERPAPPRDPATRARVATCRTFQPRRSLSSRAAVPKAIAERFARAAAAGTAAVTVVRGDISQPLNKETLSCYLTGRDRRLGPAVARLRAVATLRAKGHAARQPPRPGNDACPALDRGVLVQWLRGIADESAALERKWWRVPEHEGAPAGGLPVVRRTILRADYPRWRCQTSTRRSCGSR